MGGAEGLGPTFGQILHILQDIFDIYRLCNTIPDEALEIRLHIFANNEYRLFKTRRLRVVNGKVKDSLSVCRDRFRLLQASETTAHSGRHNHQRRLHKFITSY